MKCEGVGNAGARIVPASLLTDVALGDPQGSPSAPCTGAAMDSIRGWNPCLLSSKRCLACLHVSQVLVAGVAER